jgi:hypothetical protein
LHATCCAVILRVKVWDKLRPALFRNITPRWVVVLYRRFGITYRFHLQGSRSSRLGLDPWRWDRYIVAKLR